MRSRSITWVTDGVSDTNIRRCRDYVKTLTTPFLAWSSSDIYNTRRWMFTLTRYVNQRDIQALVPVDSVYDIITKGGQYTHSDVISELVSRGFEYEGAAAKQVGAVRGLVPEPDLLGEIAQLNAANHELRARLATQEALLEMFSSGALDT